MTTYNMQGAPQGNMTQNPFNMFAAGTLLGAGGALTADMVVQGVKDAKWGKWLALGELGLLVLGGNNAQNNANTAMGLVNGVAAGGSYAQADIVALRSAVQNLATGMQNLNPMGYIGLSTSTQPSSSASVAAPSQSQNNTGILILGLALLAMK